MTSENVRESTCDVLMAEKFSVSDRDCAEMDRMKILPKLFSDLKSSLEHLLPTLEGVPFRIQASALQLLLQLSDREG